MSKKSITELHSIAKDAMAVVEQIKNGKFTLTEAEVARLSQIKSYIDTLKESAELQHLWENATAGASSAGSIATVVSGGPSKPIKRMDEYSTNPKMTPVGKDGKPMKKSKVKEDWKSTAKKAAVGAGVVGALGAGVVAGNMDDSNSILINGTKYEHVDDIGGNIPFERYTKVVQLNNGKYALLWKEGAGSLKQHPGSNQLLFTWCDKQGRPLPDDQNSNDYSMKHQMPSYKIKYVVKEDMGVIEPVTNDETTAINNLKGVTGSKFSGTQVGNALNKAQSGATLTTTDQKVLQPILNTVGNVVDDPNSANQFRSTAQRAGAINMAKVNAQKQQVVQQQQKNQQAANPTNPNNPTTSSTLSANPNSLGAQNNIGTQFKAGGNGQNLAQQQTNLESKAPKGKRVSESSLMNQYLNFKGSSNGK